MAKKSKESKVSVIDHLVPNVEDTIEETIEISDMTSAWVAWANSSYDKFQPFNELGDNIMAAISNSADSTGKMFINFDFSNNTGSFEHSGGITFPHTAYELTRCFTYGGKQQTNFNKHGCA